MILTVESTGEAPSWFPSAHVSGALHVEVTLLVSADSLNRGRASLPCRMICSGVFEIRALEAPYFMSPKAGWPASFG